MERICLDRDFPVALLRKNPEAVKKAEEYGSTGTEIATTPTNAFETCFGAFRSRNAETKRQASDDLLNSHEAVSHRKTHPFKRCHYGRNNNR